MKIAKFKQLNFRINALILVVILISFSLLFLLVTSYFEDYVSKRAEVDLNNQLNSVVQQLRNKHKEIVNIGSIISSEPTITRSLNQLSSRGISQAINRLVTIYPFFHYVILIDQDGEIFAVTTRDSEGKRIPGENLLGASTKNIPRLSEHMHDKISTIMPLEDPWLSSLGLPISRTQWFISPVKFQEEVIGWVLVSYDWETQVSKLLDESGRELQRAGMPVVGLQIHSAEQLLLESSVQNKSDNAISILSARREADFIEKGLQIVLEFNREEVFSFVKTASRLMLVLFLIIAALIFFVLHISISRLVLNRIMNIRQGALAVQQGALDYQIPIDGDDELVQLAELFNDMTRSLADIAKIATDIANGDFSDDIHPRTDKDQLSIALLNMTQQLKKSSSENEQQQWLKSGQNYLYEKIRGQLEVDEISSRVTTFLSSYLDSPLSFLYVYDTNSKVYHLRGRYAVNSTDIVFRSFKKGQGILGQAVLENKAILISDIPDDYTKVGTTLGNAQPKQILLCPFSVGSEVKALLEIGMFSPFSENKLELLDLVSETIAISLQSSQDRMQLNLLLNDSQRKSTELQIQQEELKLSAEELAQASQYKSEFLANMSHELRTPLNSLLILARLLAENSDGNLSEDDVESAEVIHDSGRHLLGLINDILDLSKVEAGQMQFNQEQVSLSDFAHGMKNRFKHMAEDKSIDFKIVLAENLPPFILTDSMKLGQIITNLLSNAIKFTKQGSVTLDICAHSERGLLDESEDVIVFAIKDTGIGIEESKQSHVFEAFKQADGSTSREHGGTGLGLSISLSFAHFLGGDIGLQSILGKGSVFKLVLPVRDEQNVIVDTETVSHINARADVKQLPDKERVLADTFDKTNAVTTRLLTGHSFPPFIDDRDQLESDKKLLLIVEDDRHFAKILYDTCHAQNCQAIVASDGETGVQLSTEHDFSGIILDYMLPGLDGAGVLAKLKSNQATQHIPVHLISALDNLSNMRELGAVGQSSKPVSSDKLKSIIDLLTDNKQGLPTVLIVEDDSAALFAIKKLLKSLDVRISGVNTGQAALDIIHQQKFDVIILDLGLPDISGFALLDKLSVDKSIDLSIFIIIHSGMELSVEQHKKLAPFGGKVILKSDNSHEELLTAVTQFANQLTPNSENKNLIDDIQPTESKDLDPSNQMQTDSEPKPIPEPQPTNKLPLNKEVQTDKTDLASKANILLVDDDMRNLFSLAKVLRKYGYEVRIASSGPQSLNLLEEHPDIDVILMDIMMPEMDGYQAIGLIRNIDRFKETTIIALTANVMPGDKEKCLQSGANYYLAKPIEIDELLDLLKGI
ncbi:MAG: response regulator [Pseudomonadales bacterium]|nr:response regulator [Pseudomonadales bacterium]NRA16683.1 response regulator [Oceanospirillaceae bacterium]